MICIAIAFLTVASLQEVLNGTENTLLRTKFSTASNLHLFVESAFMVHALMQMANVFGPILGGLINTAVGMQEACVKMGLFGIAAIGIYFLLAIFVNCTVYKENDLSLDLRMTPKGRAGLDDTRDLEGNQTL